jgi:Uma2 family endonuclease
MRMSSRTGHASPEVPGVDERLVAPESGYEIDDGRLVRVPPALPPHAIRHSKISALLEAHVADDFEVACDMLTRLSETSDRAPDVSVFPIAPDPQTGGRQLEQLAFEVVNTESLAHAAKKAADLSARGVRRVFAVDVEHERAFEWSRELGTWTMVDLTGSIEDRALAVALPFDAVVHAAKADDAVARALLAKRNPVLVAAIDRGHEEGRHRGMSEGVARGKAELVLRALSNRGLSPSAAQRERILAERSADRLDRWFDRSLACSSVEQLFSAD